MKIMEMSFVCPECGATCEDEAVDPGYDSTRSRKEDGIGVDYGIVSCVSCNTHFGFHSRNEGKGLYVIIDDYENVVVKLGRQLIDQSSAFEEWLYETAAFPEITFQRTMDDLASLREAIHGDVNVRRIMTRMMFTQYFAAIEQYLSGRFVRLITDDADALRLFVKADSELGRQKHTLSDILSDPKLVEVEALKRLHSIVWHNFEAANALYKAVLGTSIFSSQEQREYLNRITEVRHHCVHRNGYDKESKLVEITAQGTEDLRRAVSEVYTTVETAHQEFLKKPEQKLKITARIAAALFDGKQDGQFSK